MRSALIALVAVLGLLSARISSCAELHDFAAAARSILGADQGVYIEASDGTVLLAQAAATPVHPASVSKVPTTLALLCKLGPDHRFTTTFTAKGRVVDGTLFGDLIVTSDGDPSLVDEDALLVAERLRQAGVNRVSGNLRVTAPLMFDWKVDSDGASLRRALSGQTPAAALAAVLALDLLNSPPSTAGSLRVDALSLDPLSRDPLKRDPVREDSLAGTTPGLSTSATLSTYGPLGPLGIRFGAATATAAAPIAATATTVATPTAGAIATPAAATVAAPTAGAIAIPTAAAVATPAAAAIATRAAASHATSAAITTDAPSAIGPAAALSAADGGAQKALDLTGGRPLIVHRSQPLLSLVKSLNDYSNNIFAPFADAAGGAAAVQALARSAVPEEMSSEITLGDGAGADPTNRLSPRAAVKLLRALEQELAKSGHALYDILPVAGIDDGTLHDRLNEPGEAGRVLGKTGTFGDYGASALIGAIRTADRGVIYFAILNHNVPVPQARRRQDRFVRYLLTQFHTTPWNYQRDPRPAITRAEVAIMLP